MSASHTPRHIYKGRLISLRLQEVILPNGFKVRLELITHPGAALVVPFLSRNRIIMLRQFRPAINSYLYELPAGTLNVKETPLECAKREILEETGYRADKFYFLGEIYPVPGYSSEKISIYKAEALKKASEVKGDADEILESHIFTKQKLKTIFKEGKLKDAKTISALALCGWL
ncbi:MAG: NUDIX hydrolase [Candidatus Omnitrophota bacterium]|nr:NUDIX hydrolase [Candidatus Omnitrophota bacterium]